MSNVEYKQTDFSTEADVLIELQRLTHSPGFIYTLSQATATNTLARIGVVSSPHETLNVKELTLVAGLMATRKVSADSIPNQEVLAFQLEQLYSLLHSLHEFVAKPMLEGSTIRVKSIQEGNAELSDAFEHPPRGSEMVEPFFYVGTGAYDFQYLDLALEKYRHDSDWLVSNAGLPMDSLVRAARELQRLRETRFHAALQATNHEERCRAALATFSFTRQDLVLLTDSEFDAFINKFAVTPGEVNHLLDTVGAVNHLEFKPIMRLCEQRFFMPVGFKLAQAIYESPFYWMAEDGHYESQAANNRGKATEEIAARLLTPVFGNNVHRNVIVRDGKETVHEIDVLAYMGNRAVAIQAKSKRLTALARQGDDKHLKTDFSQAVQDAYEQGLVSRRLLLGRGHNLYDSTGRAINLPESIEDVYIVCLTLDHFPALSPMTDLFLTKGESDPHPVAFSVFDLDIIVYYLTDPFEFLHYIYQRSLWSGRIHGSCEVSFLAWYLNQGLTLPENVEGALIDESMIGIIDQDFPNVRGRNLLLSQLLGDATWTADRDGLKNRWQGSIFQPFIGMLKSSPEATATDALFMLFDLPRDASDYVSQKIEEATQSCGLTRETSYCSILLEGSKGISFVCLPESPPDLQGFLVQHAMACKHKAHQWLGLGAAVPNSNFAVAFDDRPWEADRELDELAHLLFRPDLQGKKPGRNQPCWCGSGQKYKKCHL